jgi:IclR family transcriptional regulator, mhp operon transcriptional activator
MVACARLLLRYFWFGRSVNNVSGAILQSHVGRTTSYVSDVGVGPCTERQESCQALTFTMKTGEGVFGTLLDLKVTGCQIFSPMQASSKSRAAETRIARMASETGIAEARHPRAASTGTCQQTPKRSPAPRTNRESVRAVGRGLTVLQVINKHGGISMSQIALDADMAYPTTCRMVQTLMDCGMVEREPGRKRYRVTSLVETLSLGFQKEDRLARIARPHMEKLTREIVWPVYLSCRIGNNMMVRESTDAMTTLTFNHYNPGFRMPLFDSSSGRIQLAFAESEDAELIRRGAEYETGLGTAYSGFKECLEKVRRDGFATVAQHWYMEPKGKTSALSVPVMQGKRAVSALSIVFFSSAMTVEQATERYLEKLTQAARAITDDLGTLQVS